MTGGQRILYSQQFSELLSWHIEPARNVVGVELGKCRNRLTFQLLGDEICRGQPLRTPESPEARAFYLVTVQFDLEPDPEAEAPILSGPGHNSAGVACQCAGRGQARKPLPNLGTVIHKLKNEV